MLVPTRRLLLPAAALALFQTSSEGYRLFPPSDEQVVPERAADAPRWDPEVWGPGAELTFVLADGPGWSAGFADPAEALPLVESALAAWRDIPTADIRWRVAGVAPGPGLARDGRHTISVADHPESLISRTAIWEIPGAERRWLSECDVALSQPFAVEVLDGEGLSVLIHELGHCVGLDHAGIYPGSWSATPEDAGFWPRDPKMSYGRHPDHRLTADDMVGASLLRPAPGWVETTGAVAGSATLEDGYPARFVQILAVEETTGRTVGGFTDQEGRFRIEGLEPGNWFLWAAALIRLSAHGRLLTDWPFVPVRDRFLPLPVPVRAGEESGGHAISVRAGELPGEIR